MAHSFTDVGPLLRDGFDGGLGVLQICEDSLLDCLIRVIEVDPVLEPRPHDGLRDVEDDDLVRRLDPGDEELGLGEVGREAVYQEPGGGGHPGHGLGQQLHHLVLGTSHH